MKPLLTSSLLFLFSIFGNALADGQTLTPVTGTPLAPNFTLEDTDGEMHTLSDYQGKVVIVNFWATWCPPCREEMPSMERAWTTLKDKNVMMLAIDVGEDEDTVFNFTANYPVTFPLLLDLDSAVISQWPVKGLPTTYIIDPQGRLIYQAIGGREWDAPELMNKVLELRQKKHITQSIVH